MKQDEIEEINQNVKKEKEFIEELKNVMNQTIVGQEYLIDRLIIGLLTNGHILLEGVPGLGKTLSVLTLARAISADFQRIQFTPDLLPADLIGTQLYNPKEGTFTTKKGPIFSNVILADEINRSPAKVQSALLEAMQEKQVTIGEETFQIEEPFLVLATQNPIEQEGTYPLPEAQVDRFMMKVTVSYPNKKEELEILRRMAKVNVAEEIKPVTSIEQIMKARSIVDKIYLDEKLESYIVDLVMATREPDQLGLDVKKYIEYGASPRATIYLTLGAKAYAFMQGRGYVTPQDVKKIAPDILRHRVVVNYEAEADDIYSDDIVSSILDEVVVP